MFNILKHITIFFALLFGVLSNGFANATVLDCVSDMRRDGSKISIEKSAVGCDVIKAWEALAKSNLDDAFRRNVDYLDNISKHSTSTGKSADEIITIAKSNENGAEQFLDELENTPASGCWDLNPFDRGRCVEVDLGQNLPQPFKTIYRYEDATGIATSIKSLDLDAKTYQTVSKLKSRLNKYADDLNKFSYHKLGDLEIGTPLKPVNSKILQVAIPRSATGAQLDAINEVIQTWSNPNFTISIVIKP